MKTKTHFFKNELKEKEDYVWDKMTSQPEIQETDKVG